MALGRLEFLRVNLTSPILVKPLNEWYNSQKKPSSNFGKLLQERLDKVNPRRKLAKDETTKLAKLEAIAETLRCGKNVQTRQLQTWLSEDEYAQVDIEWKQQLELRKELKDKPSELQSYEEKIKKAMLLLSGSKLKCFYNTSLL